VLGWGERMGAGARHGVGKSSFLSQAQKEARIPGFLSSGETFSGHLLYARLRAVQGKRHREESVLACEDEEGTSHQ
jgi:hypothetical protein